MKGDGVKELFSTSMSIGAAFLMLWAVVEYFGMPLKASLFLLGSVHLSVGFLFYIMAALRENENDPR